MIRKTGTFLLLLLLTGLPLRAPAQSQAFQTLRLQAEGALQLADNSFTQNWRAAPVAGILFATPFYAGELQAGLRYTRFRSRAQKRFSDFHSFYVRIGWGYPLSLSDRLLLRPVISLGNSYMRFDRAASYTRPGADWSHTFDRNESEIAWEGTVSLEFRLDPTWSLHASFAYNRTLTFHPLRQIMLTAGISHSLESPRWLRNFLK